MTEQTDETEATERTEENAGGHGAECEPEIHVEDSWAELARHEAAAAEAFEALFLEAEEDPCELGRVLICRLATGDVPDALRKAFAYAVGQDVEERVENPGVRKGRWPCELRGYRAGCPK